MAHGGELALLVWLFVVVVLGLGLGILLGSRGYNRERGHPWLAGIVAILAAFGVAMYTFGGSSKELFSRVITLPLTVLIAIAAAAVLVGIPMYASYLVGYRLAPRPAKPQRDVESDSGAL